MCAGDAESYRLRERTRIFSLGAYGHAVVRVTSVLDVVGVSYPKSSLVKKRTATLNKMNKYIYLSYNTLATRKKFVKFGL